ncbi:unnamed protein product [Prunus armeniaca]|uniref:Uncharacterized protein n=1 Tax=Prunus armeniaca TaxID=36596 RepID=A0A6J5TGN1_PRUAR|nr:unnamed protein product [Prunus armeniaca]CAB4293743.1 unnamed protein product [Prunus armeniaca]
MVKHQLVLKAKSLSISDPVILSGLGAELDGHERRKRLSSFFLEWLFSTVVPTLPLLGNVVQKLYSSIEDEL